MSERDEGVDPALSHDEVIRLVGDVDDVVVTAILATGALYWEIEEAQKWAAGDAADLAKQGRKLSPAAGTAFSPPTRPSSTRIPSSSGGRRLLRPAVSQGG